MSWKSTNYNKAQLRSLFLILKIFLSSFCSRIIEHKNLKDLKLIKIILYFFKFIFYTFLKI